MPTAVPAIDRAAAILTLLEERPREALSLSEIARETGVHKATCAAILGALHSHGLVSRDSARRYSLGPALVELSNAYTERFEAFEAGRRHMARLADKAGLSCSATVLDGEDMVILDIVGDSHPAHLPQRIGRRIPLAPPLGTVFKAWADPEELSRWLDRMQHDFGGDRRSQLAVISAIRSRGFSLGGEQDFHLELDAALRRLDGEDLDARGLTVAVMVADKIRNFQALDGGSANDEPLNYLVGPVFGRAGTVVMSVNLFGAAGEIRQSDLPRLGPMLLSTTEKITRAIRGTQPSAVAIA